MKHEHYVAALGVVFLMLSSSMAFLLAVEHYNRGEEGLVDIRPPGIDVENPFVFGGSELAKSIDAEESLLLNATREEIVFLAELEGAQNFSSTSNVAKIYGADPTMGVNVDGDNLERTEDAGAELREVEEGDLVKTAGDYVYILNTYRGLLIIDMSEPDSPQIVGNVRIAGYPVEMYVENGLAYILVKRDYSYWNRYYYMYDAVEERQRTVGTGLLIVDVHEPSDPVILNSIAMEGFALESRRVGEVIYVVSTVYSWYGWGNDSVVVTSVHTERLEPIDRISFPGRSYNIHVSPSAIYVSGTDYGYGSDGGWVYRTNITYVDISDPEGDIRIRGRFSLPGGLYDKYQMDEYSGTFRAVTHFWSNRSSHLWVVDVTEPDRPAVIGHLDIDDAGSLMATRFAGERAYTIHLPRSVDPLDVIDLSNPAEPVLCDVLEMPGWVTHMEVRGYSIIAIGVDDTEERRVAVSLFDVSDPYNAVLKDRVTVGEMHSYSGANWDPKRLTVLDEEGLVVIPYSEYGGNYYRAVSGVRLVSFDLETMTLRDGGGVVTRAQGLRSRAVKGRIITFSTFTMEVVDHSVPGEPKITAVVELCSDDRGLFEFSGGLVKIVSDGFLGETRVSSPDAAKHTTLTVEGTFQEAVQYDKTLYVTVSRRGRAYTADGWRDVYTTHIVSIDCADISGPRIIDDYKVPLERAAWWYYRSVKTFVTDGGCFGYATQSYNDDDGGYTVTVETLDSGGTGRLSPLDALRFGAEGGPWPATAVGNTLYIQHTDPLITTVNGTDAYGSVNRLSRVDISNPTDIKRLTELDIPGIFAGAKPDGTYIYTYERYEFYWNWCYINPLSPPDRYDNSTFYVLSTAGDEARVVRAFNMPWILQSAFIDGDTAILVSSKRYYYYHTYSGLKDEGAPRFKVWLIDLADPEHPGLKVSFQGRGNFGSAQVADGYLVVVLNSCQIAVYDLAGGHAPELVGLFQRFGWGTFKVFDDTLYNVAGYYGIIGYPLR